MFNFYNGRFFIIYLNSFKSEETEKECPLSNDIRDILWNFHLDILRHCGEKIEEEDVPGVRFN